MNGWTAGEGRWMAAYRGESIYDPHAEDEREEEREEPEAERQDVLEAPEEASTAPPARPRFRTRHDRARARLGSRDGCVICQGEQCWCAVVDRLAALTCGHAGSSGICRGCLAEVLVLSERGSAAGADFQARRLVAAQRLRRRQRGAA
jgi:hypothetical protein